MTLASFLPYACLGLLAIGLFGFVETLPIGAPRDSLADRLRQLEPEYWAHLAQQQHTAATWQVAHTRPHERFEDGSGIPFGVRQDAAQAAFDGICLGTGRHTPQLCGQAWQRRMPRQQ